MSNSGIVAAKGSNVGVYLHWNGGRDSVEGFLKYCEMKGYCNFNDRSGYGISRFMQVAGNFLGGTSSLGMEFNITKGKSLTSTDNGIYLVDGWKIVKRYDEPSREQSAYELQDMLLAIDAAQPEKERIREYILAEEVKREEVKIGDKVCMIDFDGHQEIHEVVGIGKDMLCNGINVKGMPYVNAYGGNPERNINNYLRTEMIRVFQEDEEEKATEENKPIYRILEEDVDCVLADVIEKTQNILDSKECDDVEYYSKKLARWKSVDKTRLYNFLRKNMEVQWSECVETAIECYLP